MITYSEGPGASLAKANRLVTVEGDAIDIVFNLVARLNTDRTPRENGWWSLMTWKDDHRTAANWASGCGFAGDLDWGHHEVSTSPSGKPMKKFVKAPLPDNVKEAIRADAQAGKLPGNAYHLSPHGIRTLGVLGEQTSDRAAFATAAQVFEGDLGRWLTGHPEWIPGDAKDGFKLDPTVTKDLARYLWAPCSKIWSQKDEQFHERAAEVVLVRADPLDLQEMVQRARVARAPDAGTGPAAPPRAEVTEHSTTVKDAAQRFCVDFEKKNRSIDKYLTASGRYADGQCPMCGHQGCFNLLPPKEDARHARWCCHSASHEADSGHHHGRASDDGLRHTGDALDLVLALEDLHDDLETPVARVRLLQDRGYLSGHLDAPPANEPQNPFFGCAVAFTADRLRRDPPRPEYIWKNRIPYGSRIAGSLSAAGGTGKSSLLVGLAQARAQGRDFLGEVVRPGCTVFLTAEERAEDYERKIKAWSQNDLSFDYEAVAKNLLFIDVVGKGLKLATVERGRYQVNRDDVIRLAEVIRALAPRADFVVVETASRVGPDETNEGHATLVSACEELSGLVQGTVLVVGHVSKVAARERIGDAQVGRGGGALGDNGRFSLTLTRFPTEPSKIAKEVGAQVPEGVAERLLVFNSPKVNAAPPQPPIILECIGKGSWGLTVARYDIKSEANTQFLDAYYKRLEKEDALKLWSFLATVAMNGEAFSVYTLKEQCARVGIARQKMEKVVEQAVTLGWVKEGDTMPKGKLRQLLPVPKAEWPVSEPAPAPGTKCA